MLFTLVGFDHASEKILVNLWLKDEEKDLKKMRRDIRLASSPTSLVPYLLPIPHLTKQLKRQSKHLSTYSVVARVS